MTQVESNEARRFAIDVVRRLREAGFTAFWAGGCVRDQLLGLQPKDYDVATDALPDQIRDIFGRRRTLAIGAAFGVITVLGTKRTGQIEVATFRQDAAYSDGRHPDSVTFSTAEEDAQRRDFTINGLFYDPLTEQVIDYVDGRKDLSRKVIRAIGDPYERIAEDKLRMLRAVRFAAAFDFSLDEATFTAIQKHAHEIVVVSAERIAAELRRMLVHANCVTAVQLLRKSNLLHTILPEFEELEPGSGTNDGQESQTPWQRLIAVFNASVDPSFSIALAILLREIYQKSSPQSADTARSVIEQICQRWRLSNEEMSDTIFVLEHESLARAARQSPWPVVQRLLISKRINSVLRFAESVANGLGDEVSGIEFCRSKLRLPEEELNPPELINGNDLTKSGIRPGPIFKQLLDEVRDAQLNGEIADKSAAIEFAKSRWEASNKE